MNHGVETSTKKSQFWLSNFFMYFVFAYIEQPSKAIGIILSNEPRCRDIDKKKSVLAVGFLYVFCICLHRCFVMLNAGRSIVENTIFIHEKGGLPNRDPLQSQPLYGRYSCNEIRKTKNEDLNIVCQNLIGLFCESTANFSPFLSCIPLAFWFRNFWS